MTFSCDIDITDLVALDTTRGEFLLVTTSTVDVLLTGDEALGANGSLAFATLEALFMPLPVLVLHLFGSCFG